MEDKKDNKISSEQKSQKAIASLSIFGNNSYSVFLYKKTERLAAALYLTTELFPDSEPIKLSIRNESISLLHDTVSLIGSVSPRLNAAKRLIATILNMLGLMEISFISSFLSEMNFLVLKSEFEALLSAVEKHEGPFQAQRSWALNEDFFSFPKEYFGADPGANDQDRPVHPVDRIQAEAVNPRGRVSALKDLEALATGEPIYKGQYKGLNSTKSIGRFPSDSNATPKRKGQKTTLARKTTRQESILKLLKEGNDLTIKDFSLVIKNCSEKTIQRELAALVQSGVLKKKGERRWSRYSTVA